MALVRNFLLVMHLFLADAMVRAADDVLRVLTVPCEGTVGESITAGALEQAFRRASRSGVTRVILAVDSPGGYVYEAEALIGVLREHAETFEIVAVVRGEALSAAVVLLAGADAWVVTPGATIGAAVAFGGDASTGAAEVDAKFNGVWASNLAGLAEANGWSGDLFRAMVEPQVTLYAGWPEGALRPVFGRQWPEGMDRVERIDTDETVLALNSEELVRFGLAASLEAPGLGAVAAHRGWGEVRSAGTYGSMFMTRATRERSRLASAISDLREKLDWHVDRATGSDPRGQRLYFDRDTMQLTPASQRLWAQRAEASLGHWTAAERLLGQLARLDARAEKAGAMHLRVDRERADELYRSVAENAAYLRANLRKTHHELQP